MKKLGRQIRIKKPLQSASGHIRIISGKWRGRKLSVLNIPTLRPTTDRARETLFNWLANVIRGARCLDCFAGSGALSFEALSRYAISATLIEYNYLIVQQLKKNLALLQGYGEIVHTNTMSWLAKDGEPFNVIFLDPPFRQGQLSKASILLEQYGWLADESRIYLEAEAESLASPVPANWLLYREKFTGQVVQRLYIRS